MTADSLDSLPGGDCIHATSVAIGDRGVLIMGASGAGKSDLALRLIDRGASLISDDYTLVYVENGRLLLRAPENIAGKMEVRHLGLVEMPFVAAVPAALAVRLDGNPPRMPESFPDLMLCGHALPAVTLTGREASAPLKVEWALRLLAAK